MFLFVNRSGQEGLPNGSEYAQLSDFGGCCPPVTIFWKTLGTFLSHLYLV